MSGDDMNLWDGYDGTAHVYDEKKEKQYHSRIWLVLLCLFVLIFLSLIYKSAKEFYLVYYGQKIEAEYSEKNGKIIASYRDEKGFLHTVDISSYHVKHRDTAVNLYYTEDSAAARPVSTITSWVFYYLVFGSLLIFTAFRFYRVYHPKVRGGKQ